MADSETALARLGAMLGPGDVVLIKGSRASHMDEIATALSLPMNERRKEA